MGLYVVKGRYVVMPGAQIHECSTSIISGSSPDDAKKRLAKMLGGDNEAFWLGGVEVSRATVAEQLRYYGYPQLL